MRNLLIALAMAVPVILQAQSAPSTEQRVQVAAELVKAERETWRKTNSVLGMEYQGYQDDLEDMTWGIAKSGILNGKPIKPTVRQYLVGRWRARHQAITLRYPGAGTEKMMQAMFTEAGWRSYKEWQELTASIIHGIDTGKIEL